jgi:hypothetical protein
MRHEVQQRDKIRVYMQVISSGAGQTGLSPVALLKRVSDGQYWSGSAWQASATTFTLAEVDATDQPGLYLNEVSADSDFFDALLGAEGYEAVVSEATTPLEEHVRIEVIPEVRAGAVLAFDVDVDVVSQTEAVMVSETRRIPLTLVTSPPQYGHAGAFDLAHALLTVSGTTDDLIADAVAVSEFVESGAPVATTAAAVSSTPAFSAGGGPNSEDVYDITVDDSGVFSVGQFVRAVDKDAGEGLIHEILELPDGTSILVHAISGKIDIVDGDILERVIPTGVYTGYIDIPISDYLSFTNSTGTLIMVGEPVITGDGPVFSTDFKVTWIRELRVDPTGSGFRAG